MDLGVPSPILWAIVLAFICIIPSAGSFLVWLPASIYLFMAGHWTKAIILILWGTFVISTVDNLLRPKLMKDQTKLHELSVFFAVLGGISVFGLLGVVLGPVVLAITLGLWQTLKQQDEGQMGMISVLSSANDALHDQDASRSRRAGDCTTSSDERESNEASESSTSAGVVEYGGFLNIRNLW